MHANYDSAADFAALSRHCSIIEEQLCVACIARPSPLYVTATRRFGSAPADANRLFYFALPPTAFAVSAASINAAARASNGWTRAIIEKPFGSNSKSYEELSLLFLHL